ncbi:probable G-protein coupled receptor Mth-like 3 [Lucilia sericata]|uniref:probable G-protein coupled receptor Mth-like 3 n=1 Tax=Lucilia sericata TaxID=13632 RepID=UPI0018A88029|nr:probable G-protein coupled receptor Mth-like 3 [Lucilia sericata]
MHLNHILIIKLLLLLSVYTQSMGSNVSDNKNITHREQQLKIEKEKYSLGIVNCSYEDTIEIPDNSLLANGSYIYKNQTVIPPNLIGNYDYIILYDGSKRTVPQYKRACICHLMPCISFCSNTIPEIYNIFMKNAQVMRTDKNNFSIEVTLRNRTVVKQNIAEDFEPFVKEDFCEAPHNIIKEVDGAGWTLFENGSLLVHSNHKTLNRTEYCFDFHKKVFGEDTYNLIIPRFCQTKDVRDSLEKLYYWTQVFSLIFLLVTLFVYCYIPELRSTLHGKCFMTYAGSLALFLAIYSFINLSKIRISVGPCLLIAYFNYYLQLFHYTWMAILCYDIWRNLNNLEYKSSYIKYASCGYTLPLLVVILGFVLQNTDIYEVITNDRCNLYAHTWSDIVYLYGPCLIIIIFCLIFIISTLRLLKMKYNEIYEKLSLKDSPESSYNPYLFLFYMMVLCWLLENLSDVFYISNLKITSAIIDCIKSLQGVCIFVIFIGRRKIYNMLKHTYYDN